MALRLVRWGPMCSQMSTKHRMSDWTRVSCASRRQLSSSKLSAEVSVEEIKPSFDGKTHGKHEYMGETKFSMPKPIEIKPIESLGLSNKIDKIIKYESFIQRLFLGEFDKDFLTFPILLKNKKEYNKMSEQHDMVRLVWSKIKKDEQTLQTLGFKRLYDLSVSEMIYLFEAIGASNQSKSSFGQISAEDRKLLNSENDSKYLSIPSKDLIYESLYSNKSMAEELLPLIIHNSLSYYAIKNSSNERLKEKILKEKPKIGFAFCEAQENLGSLPYIQWESVAKISNDGDFWLINGSKSRIYKDDYDYYLLFCRTSDFTDEKDSVNYKFTEEQPEEGIVTLLVPKDKLIIEDDGKDSLGLEYQRIEFKHLLLSRNEHELIKSDQSATLANNVKGCGQLASSAILLGLMKQMLKNTYDFLINERIGLTECEIIQKILSESTRKIYSLESMLYLSAAMFDSFEAGADCGLECLTVKTLATEYAHDVVRDLRSIYGSRHLVSSTFHDLINLFDSFLDSSINNKMYLALRGVRNQGKWRYDHIRKMRLGPLYPIYAIKYYIGFVKNRRDNVHLDLDLSGYCHLNLKPAVEWLEYCLKRLDYSSEFALKLYGKDIIKKQMDLNRLATIAMHIYMMTAVTSRASHALCHGTRNNDVEKELCYSICQDSFLLIRSLVDEIIGQTDISHDWRVPTIHNRNMKFNGYCVMPTIYRII